MIYGLGTDIIEISRINKAAQRESFLKRVFTEKEIALCRERHNFYASLAVRFAAKEAVSKALGTGFQGLKWREIEILSDSLGKPLVTLHGGARELAGRLGITNLEVTVSHSRDNAIAFCAAERK
ncbi:MAG: holo-ACP synthase [Dehalobacterium sp.]